MKKILEKSGKFVRGKKWEPCKNTGISNSVITCCSFILFLSLVKNCDKRPNYVALLEHPFIKKYETENVDMATYVKEVLALQGAQPSS